MGLFTFIDRFRASSSDRSPWGDFFFEPVSVRSASGMRVSPDSAMRLAAFDEVFLMDIYPARELPIPGVTSEVLLNKVNKKLKMLCSKKDVLHHLNETKCNVVLSIGAGDIGAEVEKYIEVLKNKWGV